MGWSDRRRGPAGWPSGSTTSAALTAALGIDRSAWSPSPTTGAARSRSAGRSPTGTQLAGLVLANTGVHHAAGTAAARADPAGPDRPAARDLVCVRTPTFVRGAAALSRPRLPQAVRAGLAPPYARRGVGGVAIGDFVADIPLEADHPSRAALDAVAAGLTELPTCPALLLWGRPRPGVQPRVTWRTCCDRLPQADVQWYPRAPRTWSPRTCRRPPRRRLALGAGPLPPRTRRRAEPARRLEPAACGPAQQARRRRPVDGRGRAARRDGRHHLLRRTGDPDRRPGRRVCGRTASAPGDRVALLVPPGVDLTVAVYACWRAGAVIVVADAGLGLRGWADALRSAGPDHVIGDPPRAARGPRAAGARPADPADAPPRGVAEALGWRPSLAELSRRGAGGPALPPPDRGRREAAVLFTSGATGPAKGRGLHGLAQLRAQLDAVRQVMGLGPRRTGWSPPSLPSRSTGRRWGSAAAVPDMDVTAPGTLTAAALADAVAAVDATVVFASPAALRNVVATAVALDRRPASRRSAAVRRVMSAGAPVPVVAAAAVAESAAERRAAHAVRDDRGAAGDRHLARRDRGRRRRQRGLRRRAAARRPGSAQPTRRRSGRADGELTAEPGVTGEICVAAPHVKERYDRLWAAEQASARNPGWHRTGDVGHLDAAGRLWVEGRLVHVITTADGPVTPVGVEQRVEALAGVGGGRRGRRRPRRHPAARAWSWSPTEIDDRRTGAGRWLTPTLTVRSARPGRTGGGRARGPTHLPVDIRHDSKIDRAPGRAAGPAACSSGAAGRPAVKVLVTGASGMLGGGDRAGAGRPRRPGDRAAAPPGRARAARGAGRRRRSGRGPAGRGRPGRGGPPRRQGQRHRRVAGLPAGQHRWAPGRRRRLPDGRRAAAGARVVAVGGPRGSVSGRGAAPGPADPDRRPRAVRPEQGARPSSSHWRRTRPDWRWSPSVRIWSGDRATPSWSAGSWTGAGPVGCLGRGGCGAGRHAPTSTMRSMRWSPPWTAHRVAHGQALVVSNGEPRPVRSC